MKKVLCIFGIVFLFGCSFNDVNDFVNTKEHVIYLDCKRCHVVHNDSVYPSKTFTGDDALMDCAPSYKK